MHSERIRQIMTILLSQRRVAAKELAAHFGVSLESIRRDLSELERQGVARKVYGGAVLVDDLQPIPEAAVWQVRQGRHTGEKQAIARAAAGLIGDGATIYLDSGTTAYQLTGLLHRHRDLTVITRSLRNAAALAACPGLTVYCLGGAVKQDTLVNTGFMARECLGYFAHIDLAILSGDALSPAEGLLDLSVENLGFKRLLVERSDRVVAVADHTKFGRKARCVTCPTERIHTLVTGRNAPAAAVAALRQQGVQVLLAE